MCNNLILTVFITLHPSTSLHLILFYSIYSTPVHTIYFIFQFIFQFFCLFIITCVFLFSFFIFYCLCCCCCLCVLEACDTKTNSSYAQTYLAIKLFLTKIQLVWTATQLYCFYCIFNEVNAALMSKRNFFLKTYILPSPNFWWYCIL